MNFKDEDVEVQEVEGETRGEICDPQSGWCRGTRGRPNPVIVTIRKVYVDNECFRGQTAKFLPTAPTRDPTTGKQDWSDVHLYAAPTSGGVTRKQDRNQVHPSEVKSIQS